MEPDPPANHSPDTIFKVTSVDEDNGSVFAKAQNGNATWITIHEQKLPARGDIIRLVNGNWQHVPKEIWPTPSNLAVVRDILLDGSVVLDESFTVKRIHNYRDVKLSVNNTVEFNDVEGILKVISDQPIRSKNFRQDPDEELKEYLIEKNPLGPRFADFGGYPQVVSRAKELIETQLLHRERLIRIGEKPISGVLFTGPPGTGKTHLARIIANETDADFFLVSGPSIVSKWLGDSEDNLRQVFDAAKTSKSGRAIIFFDEIDSIAERRSDDSHEASRRLVAQMLTLMDGFNNQSENVIVIAATNRAEALDPALIRPGRFDWEIEFGMPTLSDRIDILRVRASKLRTKGELPLYDVAVLTEGWSAAELNSIWTESALLAAADVRDFIAAEDMAQAFGRAASRPRRGGNSGAKA
jgi:transitional endoplasmic reticulum ATPase